MSAQVALLSAGCSSPWDPETAYIYIIHSKTRVISMPQSQSRLPAASHLPDSSKLVTSRWKCITYLKQTLLPSIIHSWGFGSLSKRRLKQTQLWNTQRLLALKPLPQPSGEGCQETRTVCTQGLSYQHRTQTCPIGQGQSNSKVHSLQSFSVCKPALFYPQSPSVKDIVSILLTKKLRHRKVN